MNAVGIDLYNGALTGGVSGTLRLVAADADHVPCVVSFENHPNDSRVTVTDCVSQTLSSRMGTGGATRPSSFKE